MKITIEIPNFEIHSRNDGESTDFITELREQVLNELSVEVKKLVNLQGLYMKSKIDNSIAEIEKQTLVKLDELLEYQQKEVDKFIEQLKITNK